MKKISTNALTLIALFPLITATVQGRPIRGISASSPKKLDKKGELITNELHNPFDEFTLISEDLFEKDQLSQIPGRLVAITTDDKGKDQLYVYANSVRNVTAPKLEVKASDFIYESYLLDTGAAADLGLPVATVGVEAKRKVEFRFFQSATCRMDDQSIDSKKYNALAKEIKESFGRQGLKLKSIQVISSAVALNSSYCVMEGVRAGSNVSGLGWKIGATFYANKNMTANKVKIGVNLVNYLPDATEETQSPPLIQDSKLANKIVEEVTLDSTNTKTQVIEKVFKVGVSE